MLPFDRQESRHETTNKGCNTKIVEMWKKSYLKVATAFDGGIAGARIVASGVGRGCV